MKEILQGLEPSLVDLLPNGAVNLLSEKFKRRRQSISKMLRGTMGNPKNVETIAKAAINLIREHQAIQDRELKKLGF